MMGSSKRPALPAISYPRSKFILSVINYFMSKYSFYLKEFCEEDIIQNNIRIQVLMM